MLPLLSVMACKNDDAGEKLVGIEPVACKKSTDSLIDTIDLTAHVNAWNSGDTTVIRSLYTHNALYFTDEEVIALKNKENYAARVFSTSFAEKVQDYAGLKMRVIGCPFEVYDKLVAFCYRWENDKEGFTGVSIIRKEQNLIYLQVSSVNPAWTPNQPYDSLYFQPVSLDSLFGAWAAQDPSKARMYYEENAAILADEDLVKVSWRDFMNPPSLSETIIFYGDWKPVTLNQPLRIGDRIIFAWQWSVFNYPLGHGVRIMRYNGSKMDMDIRYGVRPWEAQGQPF